MKSNKQFKKPKAPDYVLFYITYDEQHRAEEGTNAAKLIEFAFNGAVDGHIDEWQLCVLKKLTKPDEDGTIEAIAIPLCQSPFWHMK